MNILSDDLVKKYFGCEAVKCSWLGSLNHDWLQCTSYRVIIAMQEPIEEGEKFLQLSNEYEDIISVSIQEGAMTLEGFHPFFLRLPDCFQKQEPTLDERIEANIENLSAWVNSGFSKKLFKEKIRELVVLAVGERE